MLLGSLLRDSSALSQLSLSSNDSLAAACRILLPEVA